jgi:hypothetical protein
MMPANSWFNGQKWIAVQIANFNDDSAPPPESEFRITDDEQFRITDDGNRRITD